MTLDGVIEVLRGLGEPTRIRLVALLAESELSVTELVQILGQSQPRLSRHLKLLCEAGLLERAPQGVNVFFRLASGEGAGVLARLCLERVDPSDPMLCLDRQRLASIRKSRAVSAESYFRRHAGDWDAMRSLHIPEADVEAAIRRVLPKRPIGDLLDIGTGTGRMLQLCADQTERAIGVDFSREMLAVARANLDGQRYRHCGLRLAPAEKLPFPDGSFDVVLSHMVLHFLSDPAQAIREAARVLRPRGRLILIDFAPHDGTVLGPDQAHRWAGFADHTIADWLSECGLLVGRPVSLPGGSLTVKLWRGERKPAESRSVAPLPLQPQPELFP